MGCRLTILFLYFVTIHVNSFAGAIFGQPLALYDLTCAYLKNPEGIDETHPRFGWKLRALQAKQYGQYQKAYHIIVASTKDLLDRNCGDMWDSKWVYTQQTQQVVYSGKNLQPDRTYYWKVRVKDRRSEAGAWSGRCYFTTGFFSQQEWLADWIGDDQRFAAGSRDCNIWDPWFRKTFTLKDAPGRAYLYMASIGYHELYINGKKVGKDVLAPVVTDHTKRARYIAYDITRLVKKGQNVAGIWLGTSWSVFAPYIIAGNGRPLTPIVSAQAFFYKSAAPSPSETPVDTLLTDGGWITRKSPNKLKGTWEFGKMGGELWDDRKADASWCLANYNTKGWQQVQQYHPQLQLSAQMVSGNRLIKPVMPVGLEERRDGSFRVDFGTNFAGWTEIPVTGRPGDTVHFSFSERKNMDTTFGITSSFVIGETGKGIFRNRFNYSSGRWLTIRGIKQRPELKSIKGWLVRTDFESTTHFSSADTLMNWIYDKVRWTFENLSLGGYIVDCPQRERMGYGGDAHATSETGMYNYELAAFYTKWMQDWRDVQGTEPMVGNMHDKNYARKAVTSGRLLRNGVLPHTAPTYWGGGGPAWGGIVVSLPWFFYQHYGDTVILVKNYELIRNWLDFLDTHVENNMLQRFGGAWDFLGDWLWPGATAEGMNNDKPETLFFNNCYRVFNLRTAQKIAQVLGREADARAWGLKAAEAVKVIHSRFFNAALSTYSDGSSANLAVALLAGIVPADLRKPVLQALEHEILVKHGGHISAGITGGAILFKLLREERRDDLIFTMLSKTGYPGWGFMKEQGATTLWEMWEKDLPGHSLLHSSFLFPGPWFIEGLAGISSGAPGFTRYIIRQPDLGQAALPWVEADFNGPSGRVTVNWRRREGYLNLRLTIPPNTMATLKILKKEKMIIRERPGVITKLPDEPGFNVYQLQSGNYAF